MLGFIKIAQKSHFIR